MAQDHRVPRIGHEQPGDHIERGRLACAIGADQAVEGADRDVERQAVDGYLVAEMLEQPTNRHCGIRVRRVRIVGRVCIRSSGRVGIVGLIQTS